MRVGLALLLLAAGLARAEPLRLTLDRPGASTAAVALAPGESFVLREEADLEFPGGFEFNAWQETARLLPARAEYGLKVELAWGPPLRFVVDWSVPAGSRFLPLGPAGAPGLPLELPSFVRCRAQGVARLRPGTDPFLLEVPHPAPGDRRFLRLSAGVGDRDLRLLYREPRLGEKTFRLPAGAEELDVGVMEERPFLEDFDVEVAQSDGPFYGSIVKREPVGLRARSDRNGLRATWTGIPGPVEVLPLAGLGFPEFGTFFVELPRTRQRSRFLRPGRSLRLPGDARVMLSGPRRGQ